MVYPGFQRGEGGGGGFRSGQIRKAREGGGGGGGLVCFRSDMAKSGGPLFGTQLSLIILAERGAQAPGAPSLNTPPAHVRRHTGT